MYSYAGAPQSSAKQGNRNRITGRRTLFVLRGLSVYSVQVSSVTKLQSCEEQLAIALTGNVCWSKLVFYWVNFGGWEIVSVGGYDAFMNTIN